MLTGTKINRRSNATNAYDLMTDIKQYILEEPKRVYMGDWIIQGHGDIQRLFAVKGPACGTVGCIAGNAVMLAGSVYDRDTCGQALDILGNQDSDLRDRLEYGLFLDTEVDADYGTPEYAQIVAERIEKFQAVHEDELRAVEVTPVKPSTKEKRK